MDTIEALPEKKRTPELDSELGRAYNNLARGEDRDLYKKALSVLQPHEEYFSKDHNWNFRMAFAYYYMDFIAWDLPAVLDAAAEFFADSPLAWASFHSFRRNVGTVRLWEREDQG